MRNTPEQDTAMLDQPDAEYVGIVVNDEGITLPPGARVVVNLPSATWEQFEESVTYLTDAELPGLGSAVVQKALYLGGVPSIYRTNADFSVYINVDVPKLDDKPAIDPLFARAEEVFRRVTAA